MNHIAIQRILNFICVFQIMPLDPFAPKPTLEAPKTINEDHLAAEVFTHLCMNV